MASLSTSLLGIGRAYSSNKKDVKSKNAAFCKKHPKHKQSPGVCSLCLNERLSLFMKSTYSSCSASRRRKARQILCSSSTTSSLSSYCSSSVSSCPSPLIDQRCYLLVARDSGREKGISWMTKSRSVAHKVDDEKRKKTSKGRFFFGLVGTRRDNKRVL